MAVFKVVSKDYKTLKDIKNLVNYVFFEEHRHIVNGMVGGQLLLINSFEGIVEQILSVKKRYNKMSGRQMCHMLLSLSEAEMHVIGNVELYHIALRVCQMFTGFQIGFAIHQEKTHLHVHFVLNTVSFYDGKKFQLPPYGVQLIRQKIMAMISNYMDTQGCFRKIPTLEGVEFCPNDTVATIYDLD